MRNSNLILIIVISSVHLFELIKAAKVSIKSRTGDWCIHAKGLEKVTVEKCFWTVTDSSRRAQELEQTFDVHPADVDEEERANFERPKPYTSFLIRLSSKPKVSSATNCLSSISSQLTIEKCHLRKSRFRLSGRYLTRPDESSCSVNGNEITYTILSSDRLCLQLDTRASNQASVLQHDLTFAICDATKDHSPNENRSNNQLWQLCDQRGNCSLTPPDFSWTSMIKTEWPIGENKLNCSEEMEKEQIPSTTVSSTISASSVRPKTTIKPSPSTTTTFAPRRTTTAMPTTTKAASEVPISSSTSRITTSTTKIALIEPEKEFSTTEMPNMNVNENTLLPMESGLGRVWPSPILTISLFFMTYASVVFKTW